MEVTANYLLPFIRKYNIYGLVCQLILITLCLLSYYRSIKDAGFVFDDTVAIVKNKDVTTLPTNWSAIFHNDFWGEPLDSTESHKSYRPLTTLMFHFEYAHMGLRAAHMKFLNLLLHCINTLLVWRLVRSLYITGIADIDRDRFATFAGALFAVHPVHTEAVSGVVGRAELMFAMLYLLCLLLTICDTDNVGGSSNIATVVLLTAAGLLFKETAVTIPLACVFLDYMRQEIFLQPLAKQVKLILTSWRYIALGAATLILLMARLWWQNFEAAQFKSVDNPVAYSEEPLTRLLSQQYLYVVNFWLLLCPQWLSFDWALGCIRLVTDIWDLRLQTVLAFYSLTMVAFLNCRRCSGLLLGLGLMVIPFLPAAGIIKVGFVIAERVLYVPSIGYCILAAFSYYYCYKALERSPKLRLLLKWLLMLIVICFFLRTRQRAAEWLNEERLFTSALKVCPNNAKVHYNIARLATDHGEIDKAMTHYHKAITLHPTYESALMNLGNLYREQGQLTVAERYIQSAVEALPKFPVAWMNLGIVQAALQQYDKALRSYEKALSYRKNYAVCYYNMGNLFLDQKRYTEALQHWQHAVALNPRQPKAWANILTLLDNRALYDDALRVSSLALAHLPNEPTIVFIRANVLGKLKQYVEAEALYKRAIEMDPLNILYYTNLGVLYHRWDDVDAAMAAYEQAIKINPARALTAKENMRKLRQQIDKKHAQAGNDITEHAV